MMNPNLATPLAVGRMNAKMGVQSTALSPEVFAYLTPDMLLAFCATKLRGMDEQIQQIVLRQRLRGDKVQILSELQQTLSIYKGTGFDKPEEVASIQAAITKAEKAFEGDPELLNGLREIEASFKKTADEDGMAHPNELSAWSSSVQKMQEAMNQASELEMMQLQSLMSQRQQASQLCTNMIQSLGQSLQAICANTGK